MRFALDYSFARPTGEELAAAGIDFGIAYTGSGKPVPTTDYIADLLAHGVGFCFVGESYATRGFEGYSAGFVDAHYDDGQAQSRGYPAGCVIFRALADTSNVAGHEGQIAEYARGYRDGLVNAGGAYVAGGYGPKAACEAARPYMDWLWGVWTWGYGFGMCPDPPPPDASLYQDANRPPPLDGTDSNVIANPFIPYWRPAGTDPPPAQTGATPDMDAIIAPYLDGTSTLIVKSGDQILWDLHAPQWGGMLGILPNHPDMPYAVNGDGQPRNAVPIREVGADKIDEARAIAANALTGAGGGNPDKPIGAFTDEQIKAEVDRRVAAGDMTISGSLSA